MMQKQSIFTLYTGPLGARCFGGLWPLWPTLAIPRHAPVLSGARVYSRHVARGESPRKSARANFQSLIKMSNPRTFLKFVELIGKLCFRLLFLILPKYFNTAQILKYLASN